MYLVHVNRDKFWRDRNSYSQNNLLVYIRNSILFYRTQDLRVAYNLAIVLTYIYVAVVIRHQPAICIQINSVAGNSWLCK